MFFQRMFFILLACGMCLASTQVLAQETSSERVQQQLEDRETADSRARLEQRCCKCMYREEGFCTRLTNVTSCDAFRGGPEYAQLSSLQTGLLQDFTCTDVTSTACSLPTGTLTELDGSATNRSGSLATPSPGSPPSAQTTAPGAGICPRVFPSLGEAVGSLSSAGEAGRAAARPQGPEFVSVTPQLGVQIPGLSFSPARKEDGFVYVPFLAQYIAAVQRYAVGLAIVTAIIMVVYGGLRYLLGAAVQDVAAGKQIITDALVGMLIALGGYLILNIVNLNVLDLPEIKLGFINPMAWGENIGAYASTEAGSSPCHCAPLPPEVNESRALAVPCFFQAGGSWGDQGYGPNLLLSSDPVPSCMAPWVGRPVCANGGNNNCIGTFQQSACGATSLATVLGYYNATSREGSAVTPIEAGRYLVRSCQRVVGSGTHGLCTPTFSQDFPGFQCQDISNVPSAAATQRIITELRAGHPIVFHCNKCRVRSADGREIAGTGGGHFMVFTGVSEDGSILSVHDVGWGPPRGAIAVKAADLTAEHTFSAVNSEGVTRQYIGSITSAYLITPTDASRLPPNNTCQGRARRNTSSNNDKIVRIPFTYCPGGTCDTTRYQPNQASIIMDSSWLKRPNTAIRVFVFIHGLNGSGTDGEAASQKWKRILAAYPNTSNVPIVIIRPHSMSGVAGSFFNGLNVQEALTQALQTLNQQFQQHGGSYTVRDITISAHSSGICDRHFARAANVSYSDLSGRSIPLRGLVAFDGCSGGFSECAGGPSNSCVMPTNAAFIINPDTAEGSLGRTSTSGLVRTYGLMGGNVTDCPAYAREDGVLRCYSRSQSSPNNGWTLFQTNIGHSPSVERVAGYAFRAFYGN